MGATRESETTMSSPLGSKFGLLVFLGLYLVACGGDPQWESSHHGLEATSAELPTSDVVVAPRHVAPPATTVEHVRAASPTMVQRVSADVEDDPVPINGASGEVATEATGSNTLHNGDDDPVPINGRRIAAGDDDPVPINGNQVANGDDDPVPINGVQVADQSADEVNEEEAPITPHPDLERSDTTDTPIIKNKLTENGHYR